MQPNISAPLLTHTPRSKKKVEDLDYFTIVKQNQLPEVDKKKRTEAMWRIALLHFINTDLPLLVTPADLEQLDQMTQNQETLNLQEVTEFLRQKVNDFDERINHIVCSIKKQLIITHYQQELRLRQMEESLQHLDRFNEILAIEKLLQAAELEDWDLVEATVPLTHVTG